LKANYHQPGADPCLPDRLAPLAGNKTSVELLRLPAESLSGDSAAT